MKRPDNENRMAIGVGCALLFVVMVSLIQLGVSVHTMSDANEPNTPCHMDEQGGFLIEGKDRH
jgi:hypothetical protein